MGRWNVEEKSDHTKEGRKREGEGTSESLGSTKYNSRNKSSMSPGDLKMVELCVVWRNGCSTQRRKSGGWAGTAARAGPATPFGHASVLRPKILVAGKGPNYQENITILEGMCPIVHKISKNIKQKPIEIPGETKNSIVVVRCFSVIRHLSHGNWEISDQQV